ncbi:MAG: deacetylase, histone deacetylase/acetoin utilization protein [Deltaproteobacteria bacterium]|nr:deacetylase, histone deacetylase/acetoin utilization protein [Deltaproteobacteria bacterium]
MFDFSEALWLKGGMIKIPVLYSDDFLTDYRTVDCENPERAWIIQSAIREIADFREPDLCSRTDLLLCHTESLIKSVESDEEVFSVARRAAGGAIMAAEIALTQPSFALIRPPGHHAGRNFNGGFCFFNNMAVALSTLLSQGSIRNALIVDIDLHYGNGTEDIVKEDPRISFKNIQAFHREEFLANVELALRDASSYDIVGCSAGFDTYVHDWGGILHTDDYQEIARIITSSNPHTFTILEGGYYISDLGKNAASYLKGVQEACL